HPGRDHPAPAGAPGAPAHPDPARGAAVWGLSYSHYNHLDPKIDGLFPHLLVMAIWLFNCSAIGGGLSSCQVRNTLPALVRKSNVCTSTSRRALINRGAMENAP